MTDATYGGQHLWRRHELLARKLFLALLLYSLLHFVPSELTRTDGAEAMERNAKLYALR